jgi:hypothetical protein
MGVKTKKALPGISTDDTSNENDFEDSLSNE